MNDEILELYSLWTGWLWTLGVAACSWPLQHPIAGEAAEALRRKERELRRTGRLLTHVAGRGPDCELALSQGLQDLMESGPWGDDDGEVHTLAEAAAHDEHSQLAEDQDVLHRAQLVSLERLLAEVFRLRTQAWERTPARVERTPVSRLAVAGAVAGWIVGPRWRGSYGPEAVRRAMKRIVEGPLVLEMLDADPAAGLERCVVEVHHWLRTGELGQPWMSQWTAPE